MLSRYKFKLVNVNRLSIIMSLLGELDGRRRKEVSGVCAEL